LSEREYKDVYLAPLKKKRGRALVSSIKRIGGGGAARKKREKERLFSFFAGMGVEERKRRKEITLATTEKKARKGKRKRIRAAHPFARKRKKSDSRRVGPKSRSLPGK